MSSPVSSVFSTNNVSDRYKSNDDLNLYEVISSTSLKNTPVILTSAFNSCYQRALLSLHEHIEEADSQSNSSTSQRLSSFSVNEDDFDATVFPDRSITPSLTTISQWRHEQFLKPKFTQLFIPFVTENMCTIVLHWIELELQNEQERGSRNHKKKEDLKNKIDELKSMTNSSDIDRLYELSGNSKDVLIDQVDWKLVATKMRSKGGFKYFDEYSLKRFWLHRCQYGAKTSWSDDEDELLDQLVEEIGFGKWIEIAQNQVFQENKKSAFMCAQRYMTRTNKLHGKRRFTKTEKDFLLSMYKHRCSERKDYRFCVSHAAYLIGERGIREITHAWTYLNPDIQKKPFTAEEDAIILEQVGQTTSVCWSTLAANHLRDRSSGQCRQRYHQLIRTRTSGNTKRTTKNKSSHSFKHLQWLQKQPVLTRHFLEQFYSKTRMTDLQRSILEMHSNKIQLLMGKFSRNPNTITKYPPLRELILKLNKPSVSTEEIYTKFS